MDQKQVRGLEFDDYLKLQQVVDSGQEDIFDLISAAVENGVIKAVNKIFSAKKNGGPNPPGVR